MPNNGAINYNIPINGSFTIPLGYTTGGKITQSITTKSEQTYNPSTTAQIIASGQYLSGSQTIAPVTGNATINDVVSGKVFSSGNGINLVGNATIASLGGFHIISGSISPSFSGNGSVTITTPGPPIAVFGIYRRDTTTWPFTYSVTGDFGIPIYDIYIPYLGISISGNTITFSGTVSINKINWVAIYK
ncbi:hypothetical protein CLOBE_53400 [Clostridium beijerinckii]|nr:hypothetical protein CLOBE_53400 [Clostridium beijerinckii]